MEALTDPHAGHAILHDFCMVIPYGLIMAAAGIIAMCFKVRALLLRRRAVTSSICCPSRYDVDWINIFR